MSGLTDEARELEDRFARVDVDDAEPDFDVERRPAIPEGEYELKFVKHKCRDMGAWGNKIILTFAVASGDCTGIQLDRYYNALAFDKKGRPKVAAAGDFNTEMRRLFPDRNQRNRAWKWLKEVIVIGEVRYTGKDDQCYSKIAKLKGAKSP